MATISAQIPDELYKSLNLIAKKLELPNSYIIRKALKNYLEEQLEDIEDCNYALEALKDNSPNIPLEEVIKDLGFSERFGLKNE